MSALGWLLVHAFLVIVLAPGVHRKASDTLCKCFCNEVCDPDNGGCPGKCFIPWEGLMIILASTAGDTKRALATVSPHLIPDVLLTKSIHKHRYYTPLMLAAHNGDMRALLVLIDYQDQYCGGVFKQRSNGNTFKALYETANNDQLAVVETLLWTEDDVNSMDYCGQTTLHRLSRCKKDESPVVQYLISRGAKLDVPNAKGETCLFNACREGREDVVDLLLAKGADPNHRSLSLSTLMQAAAARRDCGVAKLLIQHGGRLSQDGNGYSPLLLAGLQPSSRYVEIFLTSPDISTRERIDALELLGAVVSRFEHAIPPTYLKRGMDERHRDPADIILKPQRPPVADLSNVVESQRLEELKSRRHDWLRLQLEGVVVPECILGEEHKHAAANCDYICRALLGTGRFGEALTVWKYGRKHSVFVENLSRLDKHISNIFYGQFPTTFAECHDVLHLTVQEMEVQAGAAAQDTEYLDCAPVNVRECVSYVGAALRLASSDGDLMQLKIVMTRLIKVAPQFHPLPVIHLAFSLVERPLFLGMAVCPKFRASCMSFVALLIECGADVSGKDEEKNTPLHRICEGEWSMQTYISFAYSMARLLLEAGADMDARNGENLTPLDKARSEDLRAVLLEHYSLSLKCLAASAIVQQRVPYQGLVPSAVERFIRTHESC